jgi:hypothetical protein
LEQVEQVDLLHQDQMVFKVVLQFFQQLQVQVEEVEDLIVLQLHQVDQLMEVQEAEHIWEVLQGQVTHPQYHHHKEMQVD